MRTKLLGAGILVVLATTLAVYGHFMPDPKQTQLRQKAEAMLKNRERHIDCAELLEIMHNNQMQLAILDARDEVDYNLFHLVDSRRLPQAPVSAPWLKSLPTDSIKVVVSNDERRAEAAWKQLMLAGVPHVYNYANESVFREIQPDTRIVVEHVVKPWYLLTVTLTARDDQTHLA